MSGASSRNVIPKAVRKHENLDLSVPEVDEIMKMITEKETIITETMFNLIMMSYHAGIVIGYRNKKGV